MIHQNFPEFAQRAAAHCELLLKRRTTPVDLVPEFERFGERLAPALRRMIAQIWGDPAVQVRSCGVSPSVAGELKKNFGGLAVASLHTFGQDHVLLMSIEGRPLLEQLDRAFGGSGLIDDLPAELPCSADLLAKRFETQAMATVAAELGGIEFSAGQRGELAQLVPYRAKTQLTVLTFEVQGGADRPWQLAMAVETKHLSVLLPRRTSARSTRTQRKPTMTEAPFADVPLSANATLVDMSVPLCRLAGLMPGTVLPIRVARSVPLQIGDITVARGSVGEVDDQVALQITQIFSGKDFQ